jgi:predicted transcriptional regulator
MNLPRFGMTIATYIQSSGEGPHRPQQEVNRVVSLREEYQQKMETQLREWSAKLDVLKAKAQATSSGLKTEFHRQIEVAQGKLETARRKFDELRSASDGAWESLRVGMQRAWQDFKEAIEEGFRRLSK